MAAPAPTREEPLRENPKYSVGPFQPCLPSRAVQPKSHPLSSTRCKAADHARVLTPPERAVNLKTPTEVGTQSSGVYCRRPSRRRAAP
jgi:hypothetical protein